MNNVLNGLYVRQADVFGELLYRQYRKDGQDRYMYHIKLGKQPKWVIGAEPMAEPSVKAGWAYVEDTADTPAEIFGDWNVYHSGGGFGGQAKMLAWSEQSTIKGIDHLKIRVVIGMEVKGASSAAISPSLFVRQATLEHDRPIYYEAERGGQFLYWKAETDVKEVYPEDHEKLELRGKEKPLLEQPGFWIMAISASVLPKESGCLACVKDSAASPNEVKGTWQINSGTGDDCTWVDDKSMKIHLVVEEDIVVDS